MKSHTTDAGACDRCGVVIIRTIVAGDIYVRCGRVLRGREPCRWAAP